MFEEWGVGVRVGSSFGMRSDTAVRAEARVDIPCGKWGGEMRVGIPFSMTRDAVARAPSAETRDDSPLMSRAAGHMTSAAMAGHMTCTAL